MVFGKFLKKVTKVVIPRLSALSQQEGTGIGLSPLLSGLKVIKAQLPGSFQSYLSFSSRARKEPGKIPRGSLGRKREDGAKDGSLR